MGLPSKYLGQGETQVLHLRTHAKVLVKPAFILLVIAVALGALLAITPADWQPWAMWTEWGLAVLLLCVLVVYPFMRWFTTTYTLTNRRIITRQGIITKTGHDLPLGRVNDVSYEKSLTDRIFGCGTLVLTTAAETPVMLHDIPDIEQIHVLMTELLFGEHQETDPGVVEVQKDIDE